MGAQSTTNMNEMESGDENDLGFHVVKLNPNSPALLAGLEAYFDFIIGINQQKLQGDETLLVDQLHENVGKVVTLHVYSARNKEVRDVEVVPATYNGPGLLGASLRVCNYAKGNDICWHILMLQPNSPAAQAGLRSFADYILATPLKIITDPSDLGFLLDKYDKKPLQFYVYNSDDDDIRMVTIVPDRDWGGEGSLGCNIGTGLLHRIPPKPIKTSSQNTPTIAKVKHQVHVDPVPALVASSSPVPPVNTE
eukprot:Ihof_evm7s130 gene=Ihof_evmTU7s130